MNNDLISREALKNDFDCVGFNDYDDYNRALRIIDNAPTVEQPTGEWIEEDGIPICSKCNSGYRSQPRCMGRLMFAFCPICGAKMKGGETDD